MNQLTPCCRTPNTLDNAKSPFTKIIALGFYDGPTSGILKCETCGNEYYFDMLSWDETQQARVFRLAALPEKALDKCVRILAQAGSPRWPVWVPSRSALLSEESRGHADAQVEAILASAAPAELVVAWSGYGENTLAATEIPAKDLKNVPDWFSLEDPANGRDWLSFLGLIHGGPKLAPRS